VIKGSKVLIMGLTYKENVSDTRESPVREMVDELAGQTLRKFDHQTFKKGLIQTLFFQTFKKFYQ